MNLLLSCEHGGNRVPPGLVGYFDGPTLALLETHRGYDPGALGLALGLKAALGAPLFYSKTSRLVVDLNRDGKSPEVFGPSFLAPTCPSELRPKLLARYHRPYREKVAQEVAALVAQGPLLHLSVHSFTPVWQGQARKTQVGLLFDPKRQAESVLAGLWRQALKARLEGYEVHLNRPYKGTSDGLTRTLRRLHPDPGYLGLELEVRNDLLTDPRHKGEWIEVVSQTLAQTLALWEKQELP
ncbi:MAG: hypothetical protein A2600_09740 [Candidatus Lambdaproteobacteria bacterium RIFOXYD1_FULL_56_27]|uniref:N-formylglutamate amidohydrolase n=1 Tax=Candidatus Lambdaproteobacteria bacterium RIFOXYD2_FULL_56_26 TaxID=1817773 RepID=A0A1F6GV14_9PROT|nr:MAG: hypothetical protein A2557_05010 [Candidatus Lambdaproteobacteria bacterium RIFOXYD2_FULL_56_26]OGH02322.1 MAG: hypothetical protein A2426_03490 [Candidatus Lambdaproteobacteria bacterium RIFOXYC1_FULL_56_13]OGH10092.1 MAG: hypothetical protein A2600_09740 [Candidatus Lambdaproteobacteria bacterium RIFOXYD1_FULL_56_27]